MSDIKEQIYFEGDTMAYASEANNNLEYLFNGNYHQKILVWDLDPASAIPLRPGYDDGVDQSDVTPIPNRTIGFNEDYKSLEIYLGAEYNWLIINGIWDTEIRNQIDTSKISPGSRGFNIESMQGEMWNGEDWVITG